MKSYSCCFAVLITLALGTRVSAQSLADVARAEEARRKSIKAGAKVYTNEDLGGTRQASAVPAETASAPNAAKPADTKPEEQKAADPAKTEKYWKDRAFAIQQTRSRLKLLLDALQTQVSGLNAEYLSMDDPGHRGLLETRMHRATLELQRVRQDIEKQDKAAADLQEEARKSGIPAGWVR